MKLAKAMKLDLGELVRSLSLPARKNDARVVAIVRCGHDGCGVTTGVTLREQGRVAAFFCSAHWQQEAERRRRVGR